MDTLTSISRRDLLKAGGALVVTFSFGSLLPEFGAAQNLTGVTPSRPLDPARPLDPSDVDSFFAIHADGRITLYMGKVDIGTGLRVAVAQMAAEELGVRPERISVVDGDTALCPDQGGTGGSTGLTRGGTNWRN